MLRNITSYPNHFRPRRYHPLPLLLMLASVASGGRIAQVRQVVPKGAPIVRPESFPTCNLIQTASIVEKAIVKSLEKQYNDTLTPLKDSIPKRLNMHVHKWTRRQLSALYHVPTQLGTFVNTIKRIINVLHRRVEDILRQWASCLPVVEDKKSLFGEQIYVIVVLLRTKYRNYMQAAVDKLVSNTQSNKRTRLKRILEEIKENEREVEVRERMKMLCSQIRDSISNLHDVFTSQIFVASCRLFWDRMAHVVLKFLEGRKENEVGYKASYYSLGILEDPFASEMQSLQGNWLQEKDMEAPRSVIELLQLRIEGRKMDQLHICISMFVC